MQTTVTVFLALLIAHVLGDFAFQSDRMVQDKTGGGWKAYSQHGAVHYVLSLLLLAVFVPTLFYSWRLQLALLLLVGAHIAIDAGKAHALAGDRLQDNLAAFLIDQGAHLVALGFFAVLIHGHAGLLWTLILDWLREHSSALLATGLIYSVVLFAGGQLIKYLLRPLEEKLETKGGEVKELERAGMYIGWLERFLVVTAFVADSLAAVGFIIAAKSLFRFPDLKDRPFAEYFLVGTLLSVVLAALGGLLLSLLLSLD